MMASLIYLLALCLVLLAAGGFIVYLIKEQKGVYQWSYRALLAGFVLLTAYIGIRFHAMGASSVITLKSALSLFSWTVLGAYLLFHLKFRLMVLGSFVAPLAACLMIVSSAVPGSETAVRPFLRGTWLVIHIGTSFLGNGIFALTFMGAIMYLIQERQIKKKRFGSFYRRLPSLETLDAINHHSIMAGFAFLTIGMITGSIYAQYALGSYWRWDPKEVWSLITWLFYATLLHERLAVGWRGRRAAIMSIIAFGVLLFSFVGVSLWLSDYHSFKSLGGRAGI